MPNSVDSLLYAISVNFFLSYFLFIETLFFEPEFDLVLQKDGVHPDYDKHLPEHRHIYKFARTLFNAAQLTAECAIITLIYLER